MFNFGIKRINYVRPYQLTIWLQGPGKGTIHEIMRSGACFSSRPDLCFWEWAV